MPGKRMASRSPVNPRNPTGERMSRDGTKGPLIPQTEAGEHCLADTQKRTVKGASGTMGRKPYIAYLKTQPAQGQ
jgi:hypothetical protein